MTEQKLKLAEQARDEYYKLTEDLKKALEDKEKGSVKPRRSSCWSIVTLMPFY